MNLLWTLWVDMPWFSSHNYLCCIEEVSPYSYDQCKWFDVRLLHLQCINNGNECVALSGWTCIFPGIWGGLLAPRHSPGSPIPLTGLWLWQDPVMGGWPWAVFGCVALPMWACTIVMLISSLSGWLLLLLSLLLLSLLYAGISHWIIELSVENQSCIEHVMSAPVVQLVLKNSTVMDILKQGWEAFFPGISNTEGTPPTKSLLTVLVAVDTTLTVRLFQKVTVRTPSYMNQSNKFCCRGYIPSC